MSTTVGREVEVHEFPSELEDTITQTGVSRRDPTADVIDPTADVIVREIPTSEVDGTDPSFNLEPLTLDQSDASAPTESTPR